MHWTLRGIPARYSLGEFGFIQIEVRTTAAILHVHGEIDISNSAQLGDAITDVSSAFGGALILTFENCRFISCSSVGVTVRHFAILGDRLSIVASETSPLGRLLELTALTSALPVYRALDDALRALVARRRATRARSGWAALNVATPHIVASGEGVA